MQVPVSGERRAKTMARVDISDTALTVHVTGWDSLWSFKSQLEIPLAHVTHAAVDHEIARRWWQGWRMPGTHIPGVIVAGTFYKDGERVFWDVHDPDRTIVISLAHDEYARLVIQVDDPEATVAAINEAVGESRGRT